MWITCTICGKIGVFFLDGSPVRKYIGYQINRGVEVAGMAAIQTHLPEILKFKESVI